MTTRATPGIVDRIIDYESGLMDKETTIRFFGELIATGLINDLQGFYQRTARALVEGGYLTPNGEIIS